LDRGFTLRVQRTNRDGALLVSGDGDGVVGHVGARLLADVADAVGLTRALGRRPTSRRARRSRHDPGRVLRDAAVMLADGGDCVSDLAVLRAQPELFGDVASHATAWRTLEAVAADELGGVDGIRAARATARARVWDRDGIPTVDGMLTVDVDATFVTAHSDKQQAAGTYKGGYGHHPLLAFVDHGDGGTGEPLAGVLRAGNAGSNTVIDHHDALTLLLEQPPVTSEQVPMLVRTDSAGTSHGFIDALRDEAIMFSIGLPIDTHVRDAVLALPATAWWHARTQHGEVRPGAAVAELHSLDLSAWPPGTRAIVRREPLHPGAQTCVLDADGHRITVFITDQPDADITALERRHRAHARVEDRIRTAKDTGMRNLPHHDFARNEVWLELVLAACDLLAWTQRLTLHGDPAIAEPKTLRHRILHVAARITRHARQQRLRLQRTWPWTSHLLDAFARARALAIT
jgi:hypothetical protein